MRSGSDKLDATFVLLRPLSHGHCLWHEFAIPILLYGTDLTVHVQVKLTALSVSETRSFGTVHKTEVAGLSQRLSRHCTIVELSRPLIQNAVAHERT